MGVVQESRYSRTFVKCKIRAKTDDKVNFSFPVKLRTGKKKKSPSAKRRAAARQKRFQEKRQLKNATFPKPTVSAVTVPKEPEPISKEPKLSSENSDQESADHSLLVGPSSITSNLKHLESQASGVTLPAGSLEEEQTISRISRLTLTVALFGVLPMVPLVILPMVPLVANGTIGLPLVPMAYQWYHWESHW